jgi:hypothetical protein
MNNQKQEYIPMSKEALREIKVGDIIERMLDFCISCKFIVSKVTEDRIYAALWEFDRNTGLEIDEDIPCTVSYIKGIIPPEEVLISSPKGDPDTEFD